ncbi:MAG: DUF58 domain-containing protein [Bacteroidetes bacterium]|nr:MAG: DUF58 domain-containing protein [Bacteroidota bacterium]TAG88838.1 MAG: DUF58 domain-containing protein [Bacteroidota bacterium]
MLKPDFKKLLAKIKEIEIKIRKAVNAQTKGNFSSLFRGTGLEFDDVRIYQYGDDIRHIDWHVSAKDENTYIKVFKEEKEQTVFFLLDVSESQNLFTIEKSKIEIAKEICSVLALSAVKEANEIGLLCFSDQKEKYIKPSKGMKKAYEVILNLFRLVPISKKTNLNDFIKFSLNLIKRKSIVFFISDFLDDNYQDNLKALAKKHDLILIHLSTMRETQIPKLGIIPIFDLETQTKHWINTSSVQFKKDLREKNATKKKELLELVKKYRANYLMIDTDEDYIPKLIKLFRVRNKEK